MAVGAAKALGLPVIIGCWPGVVGPPTGVKALEVGAGAAPYIPPPDATEGAEAPLHPAGARAVLAAVP